MVQAPSENKRGNVNKVCVESKSFEKKMTKTTKYIQHTVQSVKEKKTGTSLLQKGFLYITLLQIGY